MKELPMNLQRVMLVNSEKGASSWLSALPIREHGFSLHKGAFIDAICLRYMAGGLLTYPPIVFVGSHSVLNMQ